MPIDKKYWKELKFVKGDFPSVLCPTCSKGHLKLLSKENFYKEETSDSKAYQMQEHWYSELVEYRFSMILTCDYVKCKEIVACVGRGSNNTEFESDSFGNIVGQYYKQHYFPTYFLPPLNIIAVSNQYPIEVQKKLIESFSHFFSDLASCANKIRVCVETLMDSLKIKKYHITSGKRTKLDLHRRILDYKSKKPEVADHMLAIKWIGNSGSHYDNLTKDDVLDAYILLNHSLDRIFINHEMAIKQLTKKINKRRAPLSKRRK
ncbi:MAG: DUF4145 domain-containing protein [Imperialibacter sp.]|uniref:DUF4145 domain-containing protein n=1 Tax=Imperialibacter sp. TaxID=2038411 RepID=UPI0032EDB261